MATFAKHCFVQNGLEPVAFAPGDEVPDWAAGKVGDHVLADVTGKQPTPDAEADTGSEPVSQKQEEQQSQEKTAEPDFTKPASKGRKKTSTKG